MCASEDRVEPHPPTRLRRSALRLALNSTVELEHDRLSAEAQSPGHGRGIARAVRSRTHQPERIPALWGDAAQALCVGRRSSAEGSPRTPAATGRDHRDARHAPALPRAAEGLVDANW